MPESRKKFLIDLFYSFVPPFVNKTRGLVLIPIVTKIMGGTAFGIWTQFTITITLLSVFATLQLGAATNRLLVNEELERVQDDYYSITFFTVGITLSIVLLLVCFRRFAAVQIFGSPRYVPLVVLLGIVLVFHVFIRQTTQFLRSQREMKAMTVLRTFRTLGEIGTLAAAAIFFSTIDAVIGAYAAYTALIAIGLLFAVVRRLGVTIPSFKSLKSYLRFGGPLVLSAVSYWLVHVGDRYVINYSMGIETVGEYAVMYALTTAITVLSTPITTVLFPDLSSLKKEEEEEEYQSRVVQLTRYYLLVGIPAAVGLSVLSSPIIRILSTESIARQVGAVPILTVAMLIYGLYHIYTQVLLANDSATRSGIIWGGIAIENLGLNVLLVPMLGITGAAIATLISFMTGFGAILVIADVRPSLSGDFLVRVVTSALLMGAVIGYFTMRYVQHMNVIGVSTAIVVGILIYASLAYFFDVVGKREIQLVKETL